MIAISIILCFLPVLLAEPFQEPPARIAAFNIQIFGTNKYDDVTTREYLVKILSRFDIVLIQEIRDAEGKAIVNLLQDLIAATGREFGMALSERLGRSTSKEQYAYFYDSKKFSLESTHQYPVSLNHFERPPFGAVFTSQLTAIGKFALAGIHTKPSDAPKEISHLKDVYETFATEMKTQDMIIMGDFNADCSYTTKSEWESIAIRRDPKFDWLLGEEVDTTVSASDCAYDRFVVGGRAMRAAVIPGSAGLNRFDKDFNLSTLKALEISDHYPIELLLYGKLSPYILQSTRLSKAVVIEGPVDVASVDAIVDLWKDDLGFVFEKIRNGWRYSLVTLTKEGASDVEKELMSLKNKYPTLMKDELVTMVKTYVSDLSALDDITQYPGNVENPGVNFTLRLEYRKEGVKVIVSRSVKTPQ